MGGGYNLVSGQFSMLGGGGRGGTASTPAGTNQDDNVVSGNWSGLLSGRGNRVTGNFSVVIGGAYNTAANNGTVVGGGNNGIPGEGNSAYGLNSFIGGGFSNEAGVPITLAGPYTVVVGGHHNKATGDGAVVVGGHNATPAQGNTASGVNAFVGAGYLNVASGDYAGILTGHDNTASGVGTVALGVRAKADDNGAFVFSDGSSGNFHSPAANTFNVLATGGATIVTAATNTAGEAVATAGVTVGAGGGSWTSLSDRAAKRDLATADPQSVLAKVAAMPIYTWRYITEVSGALHMGPTAQDFRAAFGLGDNERSITTVDADGVALAAIKGLKQQLDQKDAKIDRLELELTAIKRKLGLE
jgi:trimeric autotransporter adhesin